MPKIKETTCHACGSVGKNPRGHALRSHMPWYMDPATTCIDCQISEGRGSELNRFHARHQLIVGGPLIEAWFFLMNGVFWFLVEELGLGTCSDLLRFVIDNRLYPTSFILSAEEIFFFREFDRRFGLEPLTTDGYKEIPPRRLFDVSNFTIIVRLLNRLNSAAQIAFKSVYRYVLPNGSDPPRGHSRLKVGIIDSHFHLDIFSFRSTTKLSDLESSATNPLSLKFAIANYVYPSNWSKIGKQVADDPKLRFTLGIHPHLLDKNMAESEFARLKMRLEEYPQAVGIGEIGIDLITTCKCPTYHNRATCRQEKIETQKRFLRLTLQLAKGLGKVIVLHVRNTKKCNKASEYVLKLLEELGMQEQPIHRHCFVGGVEEYTAWSSTLPNCYFSLSSKSISDVKTLACLKSVGRPNFLLLETDSPYLDENPYLSYKNLGKSSSRNGVVYHGAGESVQQECCQVV